jgi:hypothetical protein
MRLATQERQADNTTEFVTKFISSFSPGDLQYYRIFGIVRLCRFTLTCELKIVKLNHELLATPKFSCAKVFSSPVGTVVQVKFDAKNFFRFLAQLARGEISCAVKIRDLHHYGTTILGALFMAISIDLNIMKFTGLPAL